MLVVCVCVWGGSSDYCRVVALNHDCCCDLIEPHFSAQEIACKTKYNILK